jgi:hypothetical protein
VTKTNEIQAREAVIHRPDFNKAGASFIASPVGYLAHAIGIASGSVAEVLDVNHVSIVRMTEKGDPVPEGILDELGLVHADFARQGMSQVDPSEPQPLHLHPMAFARFIWNWQAVGLTVGQAADLVEERLEWEFEHGDDPEVVKAFDEVQHAVAVLLPNGDQLWEGRNYSTTAAMVRLAGYSSATLSNLLNTHRGNARRMMAGTLDPYRSDIVLLLEELAVTRRRGYRIMSDAREGIPVQRLEGDDVEGSDIGCAWAIAMESPATLDVREQLAFLYPQFIKARGGQAA